MQSFVRFYKSRNLDIFQFLRVVLLMIYEIAENTRYFSRVDESASVVA